MIKFSVIIPTRNLSYYLLFENLPAFDKQISHNFEVIVLPNESSLYDLTLLRKYKWLRIIPTGKITRPAEKRDIGVEKAKGEIIAFIDDDAYPSPDWLDYAKKMFRDDSLVAASGPGILPEHTDRSEQMFDAVLTSVFGSGWMTYRFTQGNKVWVDDYPSMNFFIKKNVFLELGGFNNDYWPGEDSKLCNDLLKKKKKRVLYDPRLLVYHHRRNSLKRFLKQHANYGFHRGAFFSHGDENSRHVSYLIPTFFLIYLVFLFISSFVLVFFRSNHFLLISYFFILVPFIFYIWALLYLFFNTFIKTRNLHVALGAPAALFLTHLTYRILFINGFLTGKNKKTNIYASYQS